MGSTNTLARKPRIDMVTLQKNKYITQSERLSNSNRTIHVNQAFWNVELQFNIYIICPYSLIASTKHEPDSHIHIFDISAKFHATVRDSTSFKF